VDRALRKKKRWHGPDESVVPDFTTRKEFVWFSVATQDQNAFLAVPEAQEPVTESDFQDDWEYAVHYRHMVRTNMRRTTYLEEMHRKAVEAIMRRARRLMLPISRPDTTVFRSWPEAPAAELDLDETLEHFEGILPWRPEDLRVGEPHHDPLYLTLLADTSISMQGERFAMVNVALALIAMSWPGDQLSVAGFDYTPRRIQPFHRSRSAAWLVSQLLQTPPQGMTDLHAALETAWQDRKRVARGRHVTLLVTDGAQTTGPNPLDAAPRLRPLVVLPLDAHPETLMSCENLARKGRGRCLPVRSVSDIPLQALALARALQRPG
jgi:Mg-chelatase subunit ChlD